MKKLLKTGKKTLSVIMAVMMVLSAWVWVAPSIASAINSGKYSYRVYMSIADDADISSSNWKLYGKATNGSSTESEIDSADNVLNAATGEKTIMEGTSDKFPSKFTLYLYMEITVGERTFDGTAYLQISKNGTMTNIPLTATYTEHNDYGTHSVNGQSIHSDTDGTSWTGGNGKSEATFTFTVGSSSYPVPTKVVWDASPSDVTIPGSTYGQTHCQDQYGVTIGVNPTNSFSSTPTTGLSGATTNGSNYSQYDITASNDARMSGQGVNSRDVKMTASYTLNGTTLADSKTFKINDPSYNVTLNANGTGAGLTTTSPISRQYGDKYNVTPSATRPGFSLIGFYYNDHADSYETLIPNSTQLAADTVVTESHTWYAAWQANQYSMTFKYIDADGNWVTSEAVTEYYGRAIPFPTIEDTVNVGVDYTYTFKDWSPDYTTVPAVNNQEYVAVYDEDTHYADLTLLEEAIADAKAKQETTIYEENAYTESSVNTFEDTLALAEMTVNRKPLLSEQESVNGLAQTLNNANDNLDIKNYTVIFTDEDGTILKDGYFFVTHGSSVTVPSNPLKNYDETNHYAFDCWDYGESDRIEECDYVTDNLIYVAAFSATPHSFTETTTPSSCTADGVITYTCDCGYSYTAVNTNDLASHTWSTDYKELVPATCATKGSEAKYCTVCGVIDESSKREIDELGHNFGEYTEYSPATCCGKGAEVATCSRCQAKDVKEIPQISHQYGNAETVDTTCTADGYTKETCSICGFVNVRDIDKAKGHTLKVETVAETCVSIGYARTYCEKCDFEKTTTYPATGWHTYPDTWTKVSDASCVGHGVEKRVCTVCNSATETRLTAIADHTEPAEWTVEVPATCESDGRKVKDCTVCGKELESAVIGKLGHAYEAYADGSYDATCTTAGATAEKCSRCGDINTTVIQPLTHDWNEGVETEATCTSGGYITYTCQRTNCGETKVELINGSAALLHDFNGTETIVSPATCTADGKKTVKCTRCDATTEVILPKLGHSYGDWDKTTNPATNDENGTWTRECANCGDVETLTIPKGGHNLVEDTSKYVAPKCNAKGQRVYKCDAHTDCTVTVTVELDYAQHTVAQKVTDATCTTTGSVEAYCSVCGASFKTTETPVKAHNYVAQTPVAPTCTTSGYTPYKCSCGASYNMYTGAEATGHSYEASTTPATCTATGLTTYTCACGDTYTETIPATGHSYSENESKATSATCTTLATKTYECSCGASYVEYYGALAAHVFDELVKTVPATNDSLGYEERKCDCGLTEITILEATGIHVFGEKITAECIAPTCTENGTDVYKCTAHTDCGAKSSVLVPRLGHTVIAKYTAPTCIAAGSSEAYCEACKTTVASTEIPAIGYHNFSGEGVTADATCTQTGTITYTCLTDGCTATKVVTIPAKGHSLTTTVTDAKCGEKGNVVTECKVCNDPSARTTYELAAKGHIWGEYTVEKNASCTEDGKKVAYCTNADCTEKNEIVIPKLGHSWSTWVKTDATTAADGKWERSCATCGTVEALAIPRGHSLVKDTANSKAATCSAEGKEIYICEAHTDCGVKLELTLPKLQHTVAQRETEATCTKEGSVEAYCSVCKEVLSTEAIPVKAHNYVAQTPVAPTCTTSGYTQYKCSCGDTYYKYDETKPATGHSLVEGASTATCIAGGQMTLTCENCTYSTTVDVPAKGHSYDGGTVVQTQTCTDVEKTQFKCGACQDTYVVITKEAKGHTFGNWETVTAATADKYGVQKRSCSCGEVEYGLIAPIGDHVFVEKLEKAASCLENGEKSYTCSVHENCSANYTEEIPASGHSSELVYTPATCEGEGSAKLICSVCTEVIESTEIPALGHAYGEAEVTASTCKTEGKLEYTCGRCNDVKTVVIAVNEKAHQYETTVTDATCTAPGSVLTKCSLCGKEAFRKDLPKIEHTWNDGVETTKATCEKDGEKTYTCTVENCGATKTETIAKLGHDWSEWTVVPSKNGEKGSVSRICSRGCTDSVEIPEGDHQLTETERESSSCTKEGYVIYTCTTAHANGACGISVKVELPVAQHTLKTEKTDATCEANGEVVTSCTVCMAPLETTVIPATGHDYSGTVTKEASCTDEGLMTYTCAHDASHTYTESVAKLQHVYAEESKTAPTCLDSGYTTYKCNTCDSRYTVITAPAKGHSYTEKVESTADCTNGGIMTLKCACGATTETEVPALGHDYKLNGTTSATCAAAATETYKCSRCDDSYTASVGEKTENHSWNDWNVVEEASYTSLGYKIRTCKICGKLEVDTIPATGDHVFDKLVSETEPGCESDGEQIYACSKHTDCRLTSVVTLPATGHTETVTTVDATCTAGGTVTTACVNCDYKKLETIPALGHAYGEAEVTASTCKTEGKLEYTCGRCNDVKTVVIAVNEKAHQYETTVTDATCTAPGSVVTKCKLCDDETVNEELPKLEHSYILSTTENATCTADGLKTYKCSGCTATKTEVVPKLGHNMIAGTSVAATCTSSGYTPYTCDNSGCTHSYNVYDDAQPAKGHKWSEWEIVETATEEKDGLRRRSCTVCNDATEKEVIPAMKHELSVVETVASTCTDAGHITYKCTAEHDGAVCSYEFTVDLPVSGHTLNTTVNEASCTSVGSVVTECTVDGCTYSETKTLEMLPHTISVSYAYPGCDKAGYVKEACDVCDYEKIISEVEALGHSFTGEETEITKATCASEGLKSVKCSRCDAVSEVVVPKLSHDFEAIKTTPATCTESGYVLMDCKNCDETYNEFVSDPIGHDWDEGKVTAVATCTANGEITYTCKHNSAHTYTEPVAKLGHDWGSWEVTLNPTGTVAGIQTRECKLCHAKENATIPALGGTTTYKVTFVADGKTVAVQTVIHNGKATAPDVSKAYDEAAHYSYIWDTDFSRVTSDLTVTAVFSAVAHSYGEWVVDDEAGCNNEGLRHRACACGYVQYETLASTEHSFVVLEGGVPATCTENGFERVECEICGETEERVLKRFGHVLTYHEAIDPTCDTDGVAGHYSCSRCGKNFKDRAGKTELDTVVVSKTYHTFLVVKGTEATCTKDGKTDYAYCTVCGYTLNPETVPATGHADANGDNTCDKCGATYMEDGAIVCSCSCHKNGFFNELIYKLLSFFWRLFGTNKSCECGKVHY